MNGTGGGNTISDVAAKIDPDSEPEKAHKLQIFLKVSVSHAARPHRGSCPDKHQSVYISVAISFFVVYTVKVAILLLYNQIFSTMRYRLASNILIGVSTTWFVVVETINLAHCLPVEVFWDPSHTDGRCLNFNLFWLIAGIVETLIDISILIIPVVGVFKAQLPLKTKIYASGMFLLGGL
jgi:hypothetical protein